jgi:PleD family two-component response regulator
VESRTWKILIADDNVQNVELLEAYLAELDCVTSIATDGEDTLAKVRSDKPDLLLLDIMMPKMSGFEVCRKLKSDPATSDIQILMITSLHETADIDRGVEAGTDDFLSKPVQKQILLTRVKSLLKVRHLQSELERTLSYLREVEGRRG